MTRRARHTGTIEKRGNSWRIRYYIEPDSNGRSKQATETVRGTKKDAEKVLRDRITSVEQGCYIAADSQNVSEFMDYWLENYAATNTTVRTQQGYRQKIDGYIKPAFGGTTLQNLRPQHIQKLYARWSPSRSNGPAYPQDTETIARSCRQMGPYY